MGVSYTHNSSDQGQTPLHLQSALILTFIGCCTACTSAGRYFFFSETSIARLMRRSLPVATIQQRQPQQLSSAPPPSPIWAAPSRVASTCDVLLLPPPHLAILSSGVSLSSALTTVSSSRYRSWYLSPATTAKQPHGQQQNHSPGIGTEAAHHPSPQSPMIIHHHKLNGECIQLCRLGLPYRRRSARPPPGGCRSRGCYPKPW